MPDGAGEWVSTTMRSVDVCGRWPLIMPEHRAQRPEWPWWEWPRLASMKANLGPGDIVYDVGTEEGDQSALYARWVAEPADAPVMVSLSCGHGFRSTAGRYEVGQRVSCGPLDNQHVTEVNGRRAGGVVLIEPHARVWPNVKAIFDANAIPDPIACFVGFAGDVDRGEGDLHVDWPPETDGPMIGDHGFLHIDEAPHVPMIRLDTVATYVGQPDAITIDVEGAELLVLQGAEQILRDCHPLVWVSIHPEFMADRYGHSRAQLIEWMAGLDYEAEHLAAEHEHHVLFHRWGANLPYGGYYDVDLD